MILQNMIIPQKEICDKEDLYYRQEKGCVKRFSGHLVIEKGGECSFFSYYNEFSLVKWQEYTDISEFFVHLGVNGKGKAVLCHATIQDGNVVEQEIAQCKFNAIGEKVQQLQLEIPSGTVGGAVFVKLYAEEETIWYYGRYGCCEKKIRDIKLAIGICTYRREEYVHRTLCLLRETFLQDESSPLYGKMKIYVSDNGNTLDAKKIQGQYIACVSNKNAGGTGGFTRCMIEAVEEQEQWDFTHFIFMDDDVLIEPEAIYRTYILLAMANENYRDAMVGGALLRKDHREIQHANGESWWDGEVQSNKQGDDLTQKTALIKNEALYSANYNGWWFCAIPFSGELKDNLPIPIFIHMDDMEYSLRLNKKYIFLNGIAVWHDTYENRKPSNLEYYNLRNRLILSVLHGKNCTYKTGRRWAFRRFVYQLLTYRYEDADLVLRAVEDFCKGVDFLKETEPVELHQDILSHGYPWSDQKATLDRCKPGWQQEQTDKERVYERESLHLRKMLLLNGCFLPGKKEQVCYPIGIHPNSLFRVKKVLYYDPETGMGFETQRNYRKIVRVLTKMHRVNRLLRKGYEDAALNYRKRYPEITNIEFWKRYLEMK